MGIVDWEECCAYMSNTRLSRDVVRAAIGEVRSARLQGVKQSVWFVVIKALPFWGPP